MNPRALLAVVAAAYASGFAAAAEDIRVALSPASQVVDAGSMPHFVITVQAVTAPARVMRFAQRPDLRASYARFVVTRAGVPVDVPIAISDPGPVGAADFFELKAGESVSFEHDGAPLSLLALPPGEYAAVVAVQPYWRSTSVSSNPVSFKVVPK